jgi:group I intron endonuclease
MKKHYVYKITNLLNNKIYIGYHASSDIENDTYMGSGKLIKRAIRKNGVINFKREILFVYDTENDAKDKERELVNIDFVNEDYTYNIALGGFGGGLIGETNPFFGKHHTKDVLDKLSSLAKLRTHSDETKKKISESLLSSEAFKASMNDERAEKISKSRKANSKPKVVKEKLPRKKVNNWWTGTKINKDPEKIRKTAEKQRGRTFSDERKANISKALKGKSLGENNGNFIGYYITPFGKFPSLVSASKEIGNAPICIRDRCVIKNCNTVKDSSVRTDKKITTDMLGKTWKELGWGFEEVIKDVTNGKS